MYNAMNLLISGFEKMQSVSGNTVDVKSITAARAELSNMRTMLNETSTSVQNLTSVSSIAGAAVKTIGESSANISKVSNAMNSAANATQKFTSGTSQSVQASNVLTSSIDRFDNAFVTAKLHSTAFFASVKSAAQIKFNSAISQINSIGLSLKNGTSAARNLAPALKDVVATLTQGKSGATGFYNALKNIGKISVVGLTTGLKGLGTNLVNIKNKIVSATTIGVSKFKQLAGAMKESASSGNGLIGVIGRIAAALGTVVGAKQILGLSDSVAQTKARLDLMNDGLQSTKELQDKIFESAERSRGSYLETADAVSKMGILAGEAFSSNDEIIDFMEQINKQFTISGTSTEGVKAAMLQLTQAMGSGVLRGEELNSILEQAPTITQTIAKSLGVSTGELRNMAAQGLITSEVVKTAILGAAEETNAKFESMPKTFGQIWESFKNNALKAFQPILEKLNELANSGKLQEYINKIIEAIVKVSDVVMNVITWVLDHQDIVKAAFVGLAVAIGGMTAAMWAFNIASYANPVVWIVVAIIAAVALLVAGIVLVVEHWNEIKDVALSCWESIKGAWGNVANWFKGIWDSIVSSVTGLWNNIVSIFTAIKNFFVSIWNSIYTVVSTFWGAIWNTISPLVMAIWNLISTVFIIIWTIISTVMQGIFSVISNIWNAIWNWVSVVLNAIWNTITSIWNSIYNAVSGVLSRIFGVVSNVWSSIFSAVSNKVMEIYNSVQTKFTEILNYLGTLKDKFLQKGHEIIDGLITGIADKINGVVSKIKELGEKAVGAIKQFFNIHSPSKVMRELGNFTFEGFNLGLEDQIEAIKNTSLDMGAVVTTNSIPDIKANLLGNDSVRRDFSAMRENIASNTTNSTYIHAPVTVTQKNDIVVQNGESTDNLIKKLSRGMEENAEIVWKGVLA